MNTFKVGDKVEYIKDHDGRKAGTKATVKRAFEGDNLIVVTDEFGAENHAFSTRFKLAQPSFKVGDRVKLTATDWAGRTGKVINPNRGTSLWPVEVEVDGGGAGIYYAHELEHITEPEAEEVKPFTFKDIQKGDKIRRTKTYPSGSVEVYEGVVTDPADGGYWSDGAFILAYDSDAFKSSVTLELLERPEPVKTPEETLVDGAKIGTKILVDLKNGIRKVYTKDAEDKWTTLVIKPYGVHKGFDWTDARMKVNLKDRDTKLVTR